MPEENSAATLVNSLDASDEQELVTCTVDNIEFGLDIHAVQEIVRLPKITPVPKAPSYVKGVSNLRGNVLPIINSRTRFGMPDSQNDENSRVIVVELNGSSTGMIVDAVREVMHVKKRDIEKAPPVVHGVDSKYLSGIVKLDDGKRLVMLLAHDQLTDLKDFGSGATTQAAAHETRAETSHGAVSDARGDEYEHLVTFRLADEEYGIPIMDVQEIIRVPSITAVPNAPGGVTGVTSLRNRILPVVDLRTKFSFTTLSSLTDGLCEQLRQGERQLNDWVRQLGEAVGQAGSRMDAALETSRNELVRWIDAFITTDKMVTALMSPLREALGNLYAGADQVGEGLRRGDTQAAMLSFRETVEPIHVELGVMFRKVLAGIARREDERCVVVSLADASVALRVDAVNEVLNVPKAAVEPTPAIVSGKGHSRDQIRGVAKLDDGKRLIMMLDVQKLVRESDLGAAVEAAGADAAAAASNEGTAQMNASTEGDERQLVSFKVANEEFAMDIMQVQEIIRLEKVTKVPHAPTFVEGLVNLRGNVLPVIDLRRRFEMASQEYNDATRVVVIDIQCRRTGIIVDAVSEVMRLAKGAVEPAPAIVTAGLDKELIEGVGKLDAGKRMLLLLRADRLLSEQEAASLGEMVSDATV